MHNESEFIMRFESIPAADATRLARDLKRELQSAGFQVRRRREEETSMDFGASLVLILGAPAVVAAAKALHAWVARKNAGSLRIEDDTGTLIARNIESKDVPALAEAFAKRTQSRKRTQSKK